MALGDRGRGRRVLGGEQVGVVGDDEGDGGGGDSGREPAHGPAGPRQREVGDDPDAAGEDRAAREGEVDGGREQRDRRGAQDPRHPRPAGPGRHLKREDDPQRGEQPERVPVGDRVAEPVVGEVGADRPDVGQQPRRQRDRADDDDPRQPGPRRATEALGHRARRARRAPARRGRAAPG